jgi:DNA-3-methyladenine glycosylase
MSCARNRLARSFWAQPSLVVSRKLIGKYIIRRIGNKTLVGKIVETEAYPGPHDRASHAYGFKRTPRNEAEYLIGGHIYIYLVYGIYWQLNISTGKKGYPECVLIRAIEPIMQDTQHITYDAQQRTKKRMVSCGLSVVSRLSAMQRIANGPGKLCRWLKINKSFYGEDVARSKRFWFEDRGEKIVQSAIIQSPRIGIDYAGPYWARRKWRFSLKDNECVSRA